MGYQSQREKQVFRSSIHTSLVNDTLKRGGGFAAAGALLILLGGTLLPVSALKIWGVPIFFVGLALIALGWVPYRTLCRLQLYPHELHYDGESLLFCKQGKPLFKIPIQSIQQMTYQEHVHKYGICIWLRSPVTEKIKILQPGARLSPFIQHDHLFLPYFSKKSYADLQFLL